MKLLPALFFVTGAVVGSTAAFVAGVFQIPSESEATWAIPTADAADARVARGPSTSRAARKAEDPALPRELQGALAGKGSESLTDAARRAAHGAGSARGWSALLTLFAMGDRADDFLRAAKDALGGGVAAAEVLDAVRLFPADHRSTVLQRLLAATADTAWPSDVVADVYAEAGDRDQALATLAASLAAEPHRALIERLVAVDPAHAASMLQKLAQDGAWPADRLRQVGDALLREGHPELATSFFQSALERAPFDRDALAGLASASPELALKHGRQLSRQDAGNPASWLSLGDAQIASGNGGDAFEAYRQAASLNLSKDALYGMAKADPVRAYAAAVELAGPKPDEGTLGVLARIALDADRPADSMAALLAAHASDPSNRRWNSALVALDPARAAEVLGAAVESYRGRHRDEVVGAYGDALMQSGNAGAAYDRYREAFDLRPDSGTWQLGLARTDPIRAIPLLEARRRAVGDDGALLGALADAYAGAGRTDEARALYERAVEKDGGLEWYARMARVDPTTAVARLQEATTRDPRSGEAWGALGDCQRQLGNMAAAREAYAHARELEPGSLTWALRSRATARAH